MVKYKYSCVLADIQLIFDGFIQPDFFPLRSAFSWLPKKHCLIG